MTIAISLKVHDGVVLAADSASTLFNENGGVLTVYNNANKLFNIYKGLPIGMITWGGGSIGPASISTLAKDLRSRFMGIDPDHKDWLINNNYSLEDIAIKVRRFMYEEKYTQTFKDKPSKPAIGFIVAGYSSTGDLAEEWLISINEMGACENPVLLRPGDQCGANWYGMPDPISRIVNGFAVNLPQVLKEMGVGEQDLAKAMEVIRSKLAAPLIWSPMPIQDAIELVAFLINTTTLFYRFHPGAPSCGGPVEIAAITKHEGFKWIHRKFYFDRKLNPEN